MFHALLTNRSSFDDTLYHVHLVLHVPRLAHQPVLLRRHSVSRPLGSPCSTPCSPTGPPSTTLCITSTWFSMFHALLTNRSSFDDTLYHVHLVLHVPRLAHQP